eukprot:PITA_34305
MRVISWNVRGLNGQTKQRLLKRKVQKEKTDIIFVQETKCASNIIKNVSRKLGRQMEYMETDSHGWEGGLVTWWNPHVIKIFSSEATRHFIALEVQVIGNSETYLCINVYGPQKLEEKFIFLRTLLNIKLRYPRAKVIIGGDFNMITSLSEKKVGIRKLNKDSEAFLDFIVSAKLVDIHPKSGAYTWNNRRGGERQIAPRLDRFLVSESLMLEGVIGDSDILPCGGSDHWPISLMAIIQGTRRNKPFRFEKFWLDHPKFIQLVKKWWQEPLDIRGTKMYKLQALDYRGVNNILSLKSEQGDIIENRQGISTLITEHFKSIGQEPAIDKIEAIAELIKSIPKTISNEQNLALTREISLEEVEEVVKDMPNDKAPGPDGFTINFYKACWEIIKNEIISKVIANRLKPIHPGLISEEQSGYVEGRQILDNILLAQEMIHTLHSRRVAVMMMQLDLSKAYDKVNWNYLEAILTAFRFANQWIKWILALIESTRFSILVNGAPANQFSPSRGLRQGDPLSPFLFVILMEGLSRLIRSAKEEGKIKGLQPLPSIPATTHQQFVDDTMLHGSPTVKEARGYKRILNLFSEASDMEINLSKSTIFFFNTHLAAQKNLLSILGF